MNFTRNIRAFLDIDTVCYDFLLKSLKITQKDKVVFERPDQIFYFRGHGNKIL